MSDETVERLTEPEGRWLVVTQGSEHLFDFENGVYERRQMDGLNPLEFDRTPLVLDPANIYVWPRVGSFFRIVVPISTAGEVVRAKFRQSSLIREIRRVSDDYDLVSIDNAAEPTFGIQQPGPHVLRVHPASMCADDEACVIHKPSDHHMRTWSLNWRADTGVMERLCPHGIGHPDPDAVAHAERQGVEGFGVHGCDGCCRSPQ
jgi:hypothetical protein